MAGLGSLPVELRRLYPEASSGEGLEGSALQHATALKKRREFYWFDCDFCAKRSDNPFFVQTSPQGSRLETYSGA